MVEGVFERCSCLKACVAAALDARLHIMCVGTLTDGPQATLAFQALILTSVRAEVAWQIVTATRVLLVLWMQSTFATSNGVGIIRESQHNVPLQFVATRPKGARHCQQLTTRYSESRNHTLAAPLPRSQALLRGGSPRCSTHTRMQRSTRVLTPLAPCPSRAPPCRSSCE